MSTISSHVMAEKYHIIHLKDKTIVFILVVGFVLSKIVKLPCLFRTMFTKGVAKSGLGLGFGLGSECLVPGMFMPCTCLFQIHTCYTLSESCSKALRPTSRFIFVSYICLVHQRSSSNCPKQPTSTQIDYNFETNCGASSHRHLHLFAKIESYEHAVTSALFAEIDEKL